MLNIVFLLLFVAGGALAGGTTVWMHSQSRVGNKKIYVVYVGFIFLFLAICAAIGELKKHPDISGVFFETIVGVLAYASTFILYRRIIRSRQTSS